MISPSSARRRQTSSRRTVVSFLAGCLAAAGIGLSPCASAEDTLTYRDSWRIAVVEGPIETDDGFVLIAEGTGRCVLLGTFHLRIEATLVPVENERDPSVVTYRATGASVATTPTGDRLSIQISGIVQYSVDPQGRLAPRAGPLELDWLATSECEGRLAGAVGGGIIRGRSYPNGLFLGKTTGVLRLPGGQ